MVSAKGVDHRLCGSEGGAAVVSHLRARRNEEAACRLCSLIACWLAIIRPLRIVKVWCLWK